MTSNISRYPWRYFANTYFHYDDFAPPVFVYASSSIMPQKGGFQYQVLLHWASPNDDAFNSRGISLV